MDHPLMGKQDWSNHIFVYWLSRVIVSELSLRRYNISRQLDEYCHQCDHKIECGFSLDIVVIKGKSVTKLHSRKDEPLVVWWNTFLIMVLAFTSGMVSKLLLLQGTEKECGSVWMLCRQEYGCQGVASQRRDDLTV
ncbi:hypothetical protein Tco_1425515, partial [Tanacetum coccineum]